MKVILFPASIITAAVGVEDWLATLCNSLLFKVFISGSNEIRPSIAHSVCTASSDGMKAVKGEFEGGNVHGF